MAKGGSYVAHEMTADGKIPWTDEDHKVWSYLYDRQIDAIKDRACSEYIEGIKKLGLSSNKVPQPKDVSKALMATTGWQVESVPAVIPPTEFFTLLANKKFPAASFIRTMDEVDYLKEPDIFHEVFGHCPLLTNQAYADFVEKYGKLALEAAPKQRRKLFRLFWYTIEFGLVATKDGLKIYGGGILSSKKETVYALEKEENGLLYHNFEIMKALRTPYRIDIVQPEYFVLNSFEELYTILSDNNVLDMIDEAKELGDFAPVFDYDPEDKNARYN